MDVLGVVLSLLVLFCFFGVCIYCFGVCFTFTRKKNKSLQKCCEILIDEIMFLRSARELKKSDETTLSDEDIK